MFDGGFYMSKAPLTEKQQKVYSFLVSQMSSGFPPTVREICAATGIKSTSTVHAILNVLEEESYIVRDAKFSRAIRLDTGTDSSMVPLVGKITAGKPILAVEEIEDYIPYPSKDADGLFALRVSGLSMRDAGILDGDIIIADKNISCKNRKASAYKGRTDNFYARKPRFFAYLPCRAACARKGYRLFQTILIKTLFSGVLHI